MVASSPYLSEMGLLAYQACNCVSKCFVLTKYSLSWRFLSVDHLIICKVSKCGTILLCMRGSDAVRTSLCGYFGHVGPLTDILVLHRVPLPEKSRQLVCTFYHWFEIYSLQGFNKYKPCLIFSTNEFVMAVGTRVVLHGLYTASILMNYLKTTWPIANTFGTYM
jgi:hypothetical protein